MLGYFPATSPFQGVVLNLQIITPSGGSTCCLLQYRSRSGHPGSARNHPNSLHIAYSMTCAVVAPHSTQPISVLNRHSTTGRDFSPHEGQTLDTTCARRLSCVLVSTPSMSRPIHASESRPYGVDRLMTRHTRSFRRPVPCKGLASTTAGR